MMLLQLLIDSQKELAIELAIAHVNHKQRPESEQEEKALVKIAEQLGVKIFTSSFSGNFSENAARLVFVMIFWDTHKLADQSSGLS